MRQATFERLLAALEAQAEKDRRNGQLMRQVFPEACGMQYDNALLHEAIVEAIEQEMDDTETDPDGQSWTDYFIYELDYGRKNDDLKAYNADGSEIPLATAADLYRFLVAKQTDKHT
nr:MAG TPA: hypothetical protein [Caudoviricetes sp.]